MIPSISHAYVRVVLRRIVHRPSCGCPWLRVSRRLKGFTTDLRKILAEPPIGMYREIWFQPRGNDSAERADFCH